MAKDSIELALSVLEAEKANLSEDQINRLAELADAGKDVRSGVTETLGTEADKPAADTRQTESAESTEAENVNPELAVYHQEYTSLPDEIKTRASWEAITERLLENGGEKLKKAKDMQGEGQLVGIDAEGKALFKDKGVEPVMYGFDEEDKLLQIYNRDPEQMGKVVKWANYFEARKQLQEDGYELFSDNGDYGFSDEMQQTADHTKEPFVASENREEWRASWLESGDKPDSARYVIFVPRDGDVYVREDYPERRYGDYGVARLLRV